MGGRLGLDVLAAPVCVSVSPKGNGSGTAGAARENFNTGCDPAMGWTSPLPAVRMRAAMLVSAVVATCRGRLRRGAIREEVLADEPHGWIWRQQL